VSPKKEDRVGYGRPPVGSRFQPGQSGNPQGRPKRLPSFISELLTELTEEIPASGGGEKKITRQRALVRGLVTAAIEGNMRALTLLVPVLARSSDAEDESPSGSEEDREILDAYVAREAKRQRRDESGEPSSTKPEEE
jgi:hypothetical protein